jgi:hypothetical protein
VLFAQKVIARHRTSLKEKKLSILHGRYDGVYLTPSRSKCKYIHGKTQKLTDVCDIVRKALRKKYVKGDVSIRDSLKKSESKRTGVT